MKHVQRFAAVLRQTRVLLPLVVCLIFAVGSTQTNAAEGWFQFLGPHRDGIADDKNLADEFPSAGPTQVWKVGGGVGSSGIVVADSKAITLVQKQGRQWAVALDIKAGKQVWQADLAPAYKNQMGDGPRSTPAISGNTVFVFTGQGILIALSLDTGIEVWRNDLIKSFDATIADYGMACSPLVLDDRVILTVGADKATVVALDIANGKTIWTAGENYGAGYSSPSLRKVGGKDQIIAFHGNGAMGIEPATGKLLWEHEYTTDFNCNIATPLAVDGGVFLSAGENHGSVLLDLKPAGDTFQATPRWSSNGTKSIFRNEWQTAIQWNGALYGFDNVGNAGPVTHLACIDPKAGSRHWQELRFGKGNLSAADGKLYIVTLNGELVIAKADPAKLTILTRKEILEQTRQAPTISDGLLFARDNKSIVCIDLRKPQ